MRSKTSHQNRFMRIITIPIRVLGKARDLYVKSMTDCAQRVNYGNVMGGPALATLPRSFSVSSSKSDDSEDLRELIRAASTRSGSMGMGNRVDMNLYLQQQMRHSTSTGVPRSCSVGMGRIDEEGPCDFGEDQLMYPRSRSYAVAKRRVVF